MQDTSLAQERDNACHWDFVADHPLNNALWDLRGSLEAGDVRQSLVSFVQVKNILGPLLSGPSEPAHNPTKAALCDDVIRALLVRTRSAAQQESAVTIGHYVTLLRQFADIQPRLCGAPDS